MEFFGQIFFLILVLLVLGVIAVSVKIVPQARAYVIERLGAYHGTWETGIHFLIPFVDRIAKKQV
jgi:Membrane protease subunits, stomatin/prohibitin homologs